MASTSVAAALEPGENNNPSKVVTSADGREQSPTELIVATDTGKNTAACSENTEKSTVEESSTEESKSTDSVLEDVKPTSANSTSLKSSCTDDTNPVTQESNSTSSESQPSGDMGNSDSSSEKKASGGVNIELSRKVCEQTVPSDQTQNVSENPSGQTSPRAQPSSPNQKGRNVQFANNGNGKPEVACGATEPHPDDGVFSVDRPFVSTLGSHHDHAQGAPPATNGDVEEDPGFKMRPHHGRSYSDRGTGVLRGRTSSVIVNGDDSAENDVRRRSGSVLEVKEQAYTRLKEELHSAQLELQLKDKECEKLSRIQSQMEKELEELTASLFEEANNMVQEANIKRMHTEKLLRESNSKIEMLEAEVSALKTLVITSTPSMPNRHLHPQIDTKTSKGAEKFVKSHKRSTSHHDFKKEMETLQVITIDPDIDPHQQQKNDENREIDPVYYQEFKTWKTHPGLDASHAFLQRIIHEDILPCLNFANQELSQDVFDSVRNNVLTIELIPGKNSFPRRCALLDTTKLCQYRIRLRDTGPWHFVSQFARNRIAAVCDFYTYMRYIQQGLVKSEESCIYWEIIRLRKQMAMARLGVMS